jgi:hypothetical protein
MLTQSIGYPFRVIFALAHVVQHANRQGCAKSHAKAA